MSETIPKLHKRLNRNIFAYFLIILLLFVIALFVVCKRASNAQEKNSKNLILASAKAFNLLFAEKFNVIASSDIFIEYLRAGSITRNRIFPDFLLAISPLKYSIISGVKIKNSSGEVIYENGDLYGTSFLSLNICYLNNQLNSLQGDCKYQWIIYINSREYIKEYLALNKNIVYCKQCGELNLLKEKMFGAFSIKNSSEILFKGSIKDSTNSEMLTYFFLIMVIFIVFYFWMKKNVEFIFNKYIEDPIQDLTNLIKDDKLKSTVEYPLEELRYLSSQLYLWHKEKKNIEKQHRAVLLGRMAAQVAHDIRSPLAAISILTESCAVMPEDQRINLREAVGRIHDIANQLLEKHHVSSNLFISDKPFLPVLVFEAIAFVLSGKRLEFRHKNVTFDFKCDSNVYFSFIYAYATEFKRVISNLINNAVEAIDVEQGTVFIALQKDVENNQLIITIQDTGCGMSEEKVRHLLSDQLVETSKKDGHGLGLSHTKETLIKLNASFCIKSEINKGTAVFLKIPLVETPHWIASEITVHPNDCVIILDDDHSIHGAWDKLFLEKHPELKLVHFTDAEQCMEYIVSFEQPDRLMLLTDYELIGQKYNGLDVVEKVNLPRSILVTSHYENSEIIERAVKLKIKILPKTLAVYASITILSDALLPHIAENTSPDLILIDNDNLILNVWEYSARTHNKKILSFNNFFDAEKAIQGFGRSTPIYIDSDLGDELPGEEYAKILYEQGFRQIYLTTGYEPSSFKSMYWIKSIVGKTPVF